jgi:hypothetical protein
MWERYHELRGWLRIVPRLRGGHRVGGVNFGRFRPCSCLLAASQPWRPGARSRLTVSQGLVTRVFPYVDIGPKPEACAVAHITLWKKQQEFSYGSPTNCISRRRTACIGYVDA